MNKGKFVIFMTHSKKNGLPEWRFRLKSGNGKIVCQSEGYTIRAGAVKGIAAIKRIAKDAPVVDE